MRFFKTFSRLTFLAAICVIAAQKTCGAVADDSVPPELDAYIQLKDDSYKWEIVEKRTDSPSQSWLIELTSQTWHEIVWKHYILLIKPEKLEFADSAVLYVAGSKTGRKPNDNDRMLANLLATQIHSFVAVLFQEPNQPLFDNLSEDALIAETLIRAVADKDATWPALFPMAKSAIKAMDAV
jgi:PhoPQ-activated pathogenicity-related protein